MYKIGDRVRCLCHSLPGTIARVDSPYQVWVAWDWYGPNNGSSQIHITVLELLDK